MLIELYNPQEVILRELADPRITQDSVAVTYAFILRQEPKTADWPKINAAIMARWKGKTALARIKEKAWKYAEGRVRR